MGLIGGTSARVRAARTLTAAGVLALLLAATVLATAAYGLTVVLGQGEALTMSGGISPTNLPRSRPAPVSLRIGFEAPTVDSRVPELRSIELGFAHNIKLTTSGLPSCPVERLRSAYANPIQTCRDALIGRGSVTSEIALPREAPAMVKGTLLAFYDRSGAGLPYVLADVTTEGSPPLTYVIPFSIGKGKPPFGTSLVVRKMHRILGICTSNAPDCTYGQLEGIYSHISTFELSMHRIFATPRRRRESFVSADCPAPGHRASASYIFAKVSVTYAEPSSVGGESAAKLGGCQVAG